MVKTQPQVTSLQSATGWHESPAKRKIENNASQHQGNQEVRVKNDKNGRKRCWTQHNGNESTNEIDEKLFGHPGLKRNKDSWGHLNPQVQRKAERTTKLNKSGKLHESVVSQLTIHSHTPHTHTHTHTNPKQWNDGPAIFFASQKEKAFDEACSHLDVTYYQFMHAQSFSHIEPILYCKLVPAPVSPNLAFLTFANVIQRFQAWSAGGHQNPLDAHFPRADRVRVFAGSGGDTRISDTLIPGYRWDRKLKPGGYWNYRCIRYCPYPDGQLQIHGHLQTWTFGDKSSPRTRAFCK